MRIAVGGFLHESNSFAPLPTRYEDFLRPAGYPALARGPAMLDAVRGSAAAAAGAIEVAEKAGIVPVPLLWCLATPAGPVQDAAFERIAAMLCTAAADAGPLDGIMLDLHGAAVADSAPDMEGELLRRLRHVVGAVPIAIAVDPHANLTAQMVAECDVIVPYRTYPHVDMHAAGARAMALLLQRIERGAPFARAFRQLDYWMAITSQCTLMDPMRAVMARRAALAEQPGMVELAWCFGFPYADFADCGPAFAAYAEDQAQADAAADAFLADLVAREAEFQLDVLPAAAAVAEAMRAPVGPVVLADIQDNPGGGGHGDTTGLLAELIAQGAVGAVVCSINDAESAAACHAAGEGGTVMLSLGGKSDGAPLAVTAKVLALRDGRFALTGPMSAGNMADLGPCALVSVAPGVRVIVASRKIQAYDRAILRHLGVEPERERILALKSSVHFRADFGPIASRILCAVAPGPVTADPADLPFRHVRAGVRRRPGEAIKREAR
jgi:microcystin degradation protein MlrC